MPEIEYKAFSEYEEMANKHDYIKDFRPTRKNKKAIAEALIDEAKNGLPKVKVDVWPAGEKLKIDLEAEDFTSLRAALNSFLGWAYCAEGVIVNE